MPIDKTTLPLPVKGWNTSSGRESQPEGTTRGLKNARNRDWRAGGALRMARRSGTEKFVDDQPCGDNAFQAMASIQVVENTGTSSVGAVNLTDTFVRSNTASGNLGAFDGGTDSYVGTAGVIYVASPSSTDDNTTIRDLSWSVAYAGGAAARIASNVCVDNANIDTTPNNPGQASVCYLRPTVAVPLTGNFSLRLTFTTRAAWGAVGDYESFIGMFAYGSASGSAPNVERWFGLRIDGTGMAHVNMGLLSTGSAGGTTNDPYTGNPYKFNDGYLQGFPDAGAIKKPAWFDTGNHSGAYTSSQSPRKQLLTSTTYTIELRVVGYRCDLAIDGLAWIVWPDITKGSDGLGIGTPNAATQNDCGMVFYNVGSGARAALTSISKLEQLSATIADPTSLSSVVAVAGGDVCYSTSDEFSTATSGSGVFGDDASVFAFSGLGPTASGGSSYIYLLTGAEYKKVLVTSSSAVVSAWAAAPGTLPAGSVDTTQKARYGAVWRNRITLWGVQTNPDNWYFSRASGADDWDYTATPDGRQAVAGDNSGTGLAPGPITCMAGFDDDNLIMGLVDSLIVMRGDPALGGVLDGITDRVGIVGARATAVDERGAFYFVDRSGLYMIEPGSSQPQALSETRIDEFFADVDWDTTDAVLFYSSRFRGLRVWLIPRTVPTTDTAPIKSLWWDGSNTPWYDEFPAMQYPRAICGYQSGTENIMLVGGADGYIRQFNPDAENDDGTDIDSYMDLTPLTANGETELGLNETIIKPGSTAERLTVQLRSAQGADSLDTAAFRHLVRVNGPSAAIAPLTIPPRIDRRIRGGAVGMRIGDSNHYWSVEQVRALIDSGYALAGGH